jgi:hypothetical protein
MNAIVMTDEYALFSCRRCDDGLPFAACLPPASERGRWPSCPQCGYTRPRLKCLLGAVESYPPDSPAIDFATFRRLYYLEALLSDDADAVNRTLDRMEPGDRELFQAILREVHRRQELDDANRSP